MSSTKTFAVVLSGCGVYDGSEIHEAVLTLLALDRAGAAYRCFAPDKPQHHVVNHLTGRPAEGESRNVLVESARIARGAISPLADYRAGDFDGLIFPGGFGAAKNLSTFAFDGAACTVDPEVARAIDTTKAAGKPLGALCISPVIMARMIDGATVTIGSSPDVAQAIEAMGGHHQTTSHGEVVIDRAAKLVTTPCYMLDATVGQIATGAEAVVKAMLDLT